MSVIYNIFKNSTDKLSKFDYGVRIGNKVVPLNTKKRKEMYRTIPPENLSIHSGGTCFDFASYNLQLAYDIGAKSKFIFCECIFKKTKQIIASHTYVSIKDGDEYFVPESAWEKYMGINKIDHPDDYYKLYWKKYEINNLMWEPNYYKFNAYYIHNWIINNAMDKPYGLTFDEYFNYMHDNIIDIKHE